jgi:redox-sensing transcriptional repressor
MGDRLARRIPEPTVVRLPLYQRILLDITRRKTVTISSAQLAELAGVNAAKVRKDLSYLGTYGTPGTGYDVEYLLGQIERELGLDLDWPVVVVGMGNLGHALARSQGFSSHGFRIAALIDSDPAKVGEEIGGRQIHHIDDLESLARSERLAIGVITTPPSSAQAVAERLVSVGVTSILNFAPSVLSVPRHVLLRHVDLSIELQVLTFYQSHPGSAGAEQPRLSLLAP